MITESGLDAVRRSVDQPAPSRALRTFGMRSVAAEFGRSTTEMSCDPAFADGAGMLPMGAVAALADSVLARTLLTCMPPGLVVVTGRVQVSMLHRVPAGSTLLGHGRTVTWDEESGVTAAEIVDGDARAVARGVGRCYARPGRYGVPFVAPGDGPQEQPARDDPANGFLGLDWSDGVADGAVGARLTGIARLGNMYGALHGGAGAAVLEETLARAAAERGTHPLDLEVHYLRAAPSAGVPLRTLARVLHATRRFTLCSAELVDDAGALYASATATYGAS